jgi:hypothetical protein
MQATGLVNEVCVRLLGWDPVRWQNRGHFFGVSAQMMRRVLVDIARRRHASRRGGPGVVHVPIDDVDVPDESPDSDLEAVSALEELAAKTPQGAGRGVEVLRRAVDGELPRRSAFRSVPRTTTGHLPGLPHRSLAAARFPMSTHWKNWIASLPRRGVAPATCRDSLREPAVRMRRFGQRPNRPGASNATGNFMEQAGDRPPGAGVYGDGLTCSPAGASALYHRAAARLRRRRRSLAREGRAPGRFVAIKVLLPHLSTDPRS